MDLAVWVGNHPRVRLERQVAVRLPPGSGVLNHQCVLNHQSDARLVELARRGDERAFEAIVDRYRRSLLRHCARLVQDGRAEDAVQQALIRAYDAIRNGDSELNLRPWLHRIAHNCALSQLRQNGRSHELLDETVDGVEPPDQALDRRERFRHVVAAVQQLPARQRDALVQRELEGRSYREIAIAMSVPDSAVRQLFNRARKAVRAAANVLIPHGLLTRLASGENGSDVVAGAAAGGGALTLVKVTAGVVAAGALVAGGQAITRHGARDTTGPRLALAAPTFRPGAAPSSGVYQAADRRPAGQPAGSPRVAVGQVPRHRAPRDRSNPSTTLGPVTAPGSLGQALNAATQASADQHASDQHGTNAAPGRDSHGSDAPRGSTSGDGNSGPGPGGGESSGDRGAPSGTAPAPSPDTQATAGHSTKGHREDATSKGHREDATSNGTSEGGP